MGVGGAHHGTWVSGLMRVDEILLATLAGWFAGWTTGRGSRRSRRGRSLGCGAFCLLRTVFRQRRLCARCFACSTRKRYSEASPRGQARYRAAGAREVIAVDGKTLRGSKTKSDGAARCIWFKLTPPKRGSCWRSARSTENPTRSRRSRSCGTCLTSRARLCRSTRWVPGASTRRPAAKALRPAFYITSLEPDPKAILAAVRAIGAHRDIRDGRWT